MGAWWLGLGLKERAARWGRTRRSQFSKTDGRRGASVLNVNPFRSLRKDESMAQELRPNLFPALRYRDAEAALAWLKDAFGAEEKMVSRDDQGTIQHAELSLGVGLFMFGQWDEGGWMGGDAPQPFASTISIYAVIPDPDAHHARARAAGANVVRELEDQPYGSREYSARDLEGNLWSFGTYDPYAVGD